MKELLREEREEVGLPIISSVWVYYIGGIPARRQRGQTSRSHEEHKAPFIPASLHRSPISKGLSKVTTLALRVPVVIHPPAPHTPRITVGYRPNETF